MDNPCWRISRDSEDLAQTSQVESLEIEKPKSGIACTCSNSEVCGVAAELALVQCFAIRFLTNPKTIMQP